MENLPRDIWNQIWNGFNADTKQINKAWQEIETAYSTKNRHYHDLVHISKMLSAAMHSASHIHDLKTLQLAIFYHDFVYSVKQKDNEEKSAQFASKRLIELKYPENLTETCSQFILATKSHRNLLINPDLNYLLDFDLEILASSWTDYLNYTQNIRKEYKDYPDILYNPGRKNILNYFLNLDYIFKTQEYRDKYESMARQNISLELKMLQ